MIALCLCAPLDEGLDVLKEYAVFGAAEVERLGDIKARERKRLSLGGLRALKCLTEKYLPENGDLRIVRESAGKPHFYSDGAGDFNISHSGELSVAVLSCHGSGRVGIDIERVEQKLSAKKLSERFFSKAEMEYLCSRSYGMRAFFEIWTSKEALIKLDGRGLSDLSDSDTFAAGQGVYFKRFVVEYGGAEYIMTVCAETDEDVEVIFKCKEINVNEI